MLVLIMISVIAPKLVTKDKSQFFKRSRGQLGSPGQGTVLTKNKFKITFSTI